MTRVITLKGLPKTSTNKFYSGMHWSKRQRLVKQFWAIVRSQTTEKFTKPCRVEYNFYFENNPLDVSNCGAMIKLVEDILFPDDSNKVVKQITITSEKSITERLRIKIEELKQ